MDHLWISLIPKNPKNKHVYTPMFTHFRLEGCFTKYFPEKMISGNNLFQTNTAVYFRKGLGYYSSLILSHLLPYIHKDVCQLGVKQRSQVPNGSGFIVCNRGSKLLSET